MGHDFHLDWRAVRTAPAKAQAALTAAYLDAAGRTRGTSVAGDLVGLTSSLAVSGGVTLDAQGNPEAVFIFQILSTLHNRERQPCCPGNGTNACSVFWQVGNSGNELSV
ncbi:MAG TPA: ice-binding family protein [Terriglobales bacterium]|nr:ice-binding family protein [Terriglobales bacterium]